MARRVAGGFRWSSIERTFNRRKRSFNPSTRDVWIELAPESGVRRGIATRLVALPGYPASTWSADAMNWPSDASSKLPAAPVLEAWWDPDRPATPEASLKSGRDFQALDDLRGQEDRDRGRKSDHGERFHGDSDGHDRFRAKRTATLSGCAGRSSPGIPVRVRLDAAGIAGSEERFYQEAGKTVALFWPITSDRPLRRSVASNWSL